MTDTDATQEPVAPSVPSVPSADGATPNVYGPNVPYALQEDYGYVPLPTLEPELDGSVLLCSMCGREARNWDDFDPASGLHAWCTIRSERQEAALAAKRAGNDQADWWSLRW